MGYVVLRTLGHILAAHPIAWPVLGTILGACVGANWRLKSVEGKGLDAIVNVAAFWSGAITGAVVGLISGAVAGFLWSRLLLWSRLQGFG